MNDIKSANSCSGYHKLLSSEDDEDIQEKCIISKEYHSFIKVFKKASADILPPHKPILNVKSILIRRYFRKEKNLFSKF